MVVAELFDFRRFRMTDAEPVPPAPGQIQVRVRAVGICGSDLHYFSDGAIGDVGFQYPIVLGHEPTGEIVKAGPGVSGFSQGDKVLLEPAVYCYHCEYCRSGHHNVCENIAFLSTPPDPGFFREYVNLPAANVLPLPAGLGLDEGTLFEPLAVVLHSLRFAALQLGESVVVFGGGPIGLMTIAAAKMSGAGRIWCIEPKKLRREMALSMGATAVIDPNEADPVKEIMKETGQRGADVSIDCATHGLSTQQAIDVVRSASRVIITGIPSESRSALNLHAMRRKEVVLYSVRRSNHETDAAVEMLLANTKLFAPLVTHRKPLNEIESAFTMLTSGSEEAGKVVVQI